MTGMPLPALFFDAAAAAAPGDAPRSGRRFQQALGPPYYSGFAASALILNAILMLLGATTPDDYAGCMPAGGTAGASVIADQMIGHRLGHSRFRRRPRCLRWLAHSAPKTPRLIRFRYRPPREGCRLTLRAFFCCRVSRLYNIEHWHYRAKASRRQRLI